MHPTDADGVANSVGPNQTAQSSSEQSDPGLHFLLRPICPNDWNSAVHVYVQRIWILLGLDILKWLMIFNFQHSGHDWSLKCLRILRLTNRLLQDLIYHRLGLYFGETLLKTVSNWLLVPLFDYRFTFSSKITGRLDCQHALDIYVLTFRKAFQTKPLKYSVPCSIFVCLVQCCIVSFVRNGVDYVRLCSMENLHQYQNHSYHMVSLLFSG